MTSDDAPDEAATLRALRASVAQLSRLIDSHAIDREGVIPAAVIDLARDMGLFALTIPELYGGLGLSLQGACGIVAELAYVDRSVAVMLGLHNGLGTRGIIAFGSPEQRARLLPGLALGAPIASFCATEAGAGSDLMAITTLGTRVPGGLSVSGTKCYVTNGGFAGLFTVLVRTPELGGSFSQSLCCIERSSPGLRVGPEEDKLGIRGSSTVTLELDSVFVPDANILGDAGCGATYCNDVLAWGRTLMSAGCLGIARAALSATLSHVALRKQFGKRLCDFPLVQQQCADMAARVYAVEALLQVTAEAQADPAAFERSSALTKVFCSETAFELSDRAIQLHGALGFIESTGVARLLRDCRITRIFEGANDVLLVRTGAALLTGDAHLDAADVCERAHPRLRTTAHAWRLATARYDALCCQLRTRLGIRIVSQQRLLWTVARIHTSLVTARASLLRASQRVDVEAYELALAEHAAERLLQEARQDLNVLDDDGEQASSARAAQVSAGLWPEAVRPKPPSRPTRAQENAT